MDTVQAAVVKRIFEGYVSGASLKALAYTLNEEGPSPQAAPPAEAAGLGDDQHPLAAAQHDLPGRGGLEPHRIHRGPRERAPGSKVATRGGFSDNFGYLLGVMFFWGAGVEALQARAAADSSARDSADPS